ncbi:MAG: hypothetical protein SGILL_006809 [Bacillariaceae sp.]
MKRPRTANLGQLHSLTSSFLFRMLVAFVFVTALTTTWIFVRLDNLGLHPEVSHSKRTSSTKHQDESSSYDKNNDNDDDKPHIYPKLPYLPIFPSIDNEEALIEQTLHDNRPTIAGIAAILYRFLSDLHKSNQHLAETKGEFANKDERVERIRKAYFQLAQKHFVPLDDAYRGRSVFQIRDDDSVFVSVASFREHLLVDTLASAYSAAAHPEKLFVGVIVNNCFGIDEPCKGSPKVVGKDKNGRDVLEIQDGVPDVNHIAAFCHNSTFQQYCDNGQVRVLYINETDALGPAVTRYYSSKLWGGETYYVQVDSHLRFADRWDALYIEDLHLAKNYPKAVLSTYPPGFVNFRQSPPFTPGTRLCRCQMRSNEGFLPRIEMEGRCKENATRPTQMSFIGAGFFFARAEFLVDVPFDPFLPWLFMGEEVALSIRAWTSGWNIYAPRKNLIGHQYRPLQMHTPHYWTSVARLFSDNHMVDAVTLTVRKRIKTMIGYPGFAETEAGDDDPSRVTYGLDRYGLGKIRAPQDYLKFAEVDLEKQTCGPMTWCSEGQLE